MAPYFNTLARLIPEFYFILLNYQTLSDLAQNQKLSVVNQMRA